MLNMRADPDGGIYTRMGWRRWNVANIVDANWEPRNGFEHDFADDTHRVYVTDGNEVYSAQGDAVFSDVGIKANAKPHIADFASWGDTVFIATGRKVTDVDLTGGMVRHNQDGTVTALVVAAAASWNDDYTTPGANGLVGPRCDHVEPHAGYLFAASTNEDGEDLPSRIRWSHPNDPTDWASQDYIDIEIGGGRITGLLSFQDHLLIFKTDSMWALYGYNSDSWQLIKVSRSIGCPSPASVTRSHSAVFFYSQSGRGNIYVYTGDAPVEISENIENILGRVQGPDNEKFYFGWVENRLLVSVPWIPDWVIPIAGTPTPKTTLLTFDPELGGGAWEVHRPAKGDIGPIITRSDSLSELSLICLFNDGTNSCVLQIGAIDSAYDLIDDIVTPEAFQTLYATNWKYANTPELRKHWMRPRYIIRNPQQGVTILVQSYRDYDETEARRAHQLQIVEGGGYFWRDLGADALEGDGFDWEPTTAGRGGIWNTQVKGSRIVRGKSFGIARSIQIAFSTAPGASGVSWGLDAIVAKHVDRRFTT